MYTAVIQMIVRGFWLNEADLEIIWPLQLFYPYTRTCECACVDLQAFMSKSFLTQITFCHLFWMTPHSHKALEIPGLEIKRCLQKRGEGWLKPCLYCKIFSLILLLWNLLMSWVLRKHNSQFSTIATKGIWQQSSGSVWIFLTEYEHCCNVGLKAANRMMQNSKHKMKCLSKRSFKILTCSH